MTVNTLFLIPEVPVCNTGGGVFLRELMEFLSEISNVHLVVPCYPHQQDALNEAQVSLPFVKSWTILEPRGNRFVTRVHRTLSLQPSAIFNFATATNRLRLEDLQQRMPERIELVVSPYCQAAYQACTYSNDTKVYLFNVEEQIIAIPKAWGLRKCLALWERFRVTRASQRAIGGCSVIGTISERDGLHYSRQFPTKEFRWLPPLMKPRPRETRLVEPGKILITTNFTFHPNRSSMRWFLNEVWPRVDSHARLVITGKDANGELATLAENNPRVTYRGLLPLDQLEEEFATCQMIVNPTIEGSGFQIKLLEAISRGIPVVSTQISNPLGQKIPASDDPKTLASLVNTELQASDGTFPYNDYYRDSRSKWKQFLFGESSIL